jgi:nickel-dependent lactate racemase
MPEIWLRYGTTDVVLDIKFENLAKHISSTFQAPQEQDIKTALTSGVPLTDKMLFLGLSGSKAAAKIIMMLAEEAGTRGLSFTIDVPHKIASTLRSNLNSIGTISINRIGYQSLNERMTKFQNTIIISSVAYDPLFGFAGAPTTLLRNLLADRMAEAFKARKDNKPAPGIEGDPLKVATSAVGSIPAASVELVANGDNVVGVHIGSINEAFGKAIAQLQSISAVEAESSKCAIISAGDEASAHSTLASALNSLWNSVHIVKESGTVILLAETREGIGGGALQMFIEGRLKQEQLQLSPYIDGLEHLLFIEELRLKYDIGLVSTLPQYYAKTKLGFTTYSGTKDILQKLQEKHGKNFKTLVLSNADITLLKPKAG